MATAAMKRPTAQWPEQIATPAGTRLELIVPEEPEGHLQVLPKQHILTGVIKALKPDGLCARPETLMFGALRDPRLRLRKAIPLKTEKAEGAVNVIWEQIQQFGHGLTMSDAVDDFAMTIAELYFSLLEQTSLSDDLLTVKRLLSEYLEPR